MSNFAKLFERDGHQVLVTLDEDDPAIVIKFRDDNCDFYVSPKIEFSPKSSSEDALDAAWKCAETAFANFDEDMAISMRTNTLTSLSL